MRQVSQMSKCHLATGTQRRDGEDLSQHRAALFPPHKVNGPVHTNFGNVDGNFGEYSPRTKDIMLEAYVAKL